MCVLSAYCAPGFQIVDGQNSGRQDLGPLISSITPGGPADLDGRLKPGTNIAVRVSRSAFLNPQQRDLNTTLNDCV